MFFNFAVSFTNFLACSRLSVSGGLKKRAGDEWGLFSPGSRSPLIPLFTRSLFRPHWPRAWNRLPTSQPPVDTEEFWDRLLARGKELTFGCRPEERSRQLLTQFSNKVLKQTGFFVVLFCFLRCRSKDKLTCGNFSNQRLLLSGLLRLLKTWVVTCLMGFNCRPRDRVRSPHFTLWLAFRV